MNNKFQYWIQLNRVKLFYKKWNQYFFRNKVLSQSKIKIPFYKQTEMWKVKEKSMLAIFINISDVQWCQTIGVITLVSVTFLCTAYQRLGQRHILNTKNVNISYNY